MPPLPVKFDDETTTLIDSLARRRLDISTFQTPRLRDCNDTLVVQQQLAAELRDDIDRFARDVDVSAYDLCIRRGDG
jgi:protein transport protein SEC20